MNKLLVTVWSSCLEIADSASLMIPLSLSFVCGLFSMRCVSYYPKDNRHMTPDWATEQVTKEE
jgi:hypothetical protein